MAMTNAERQARYRARLKARASGAATPELVDKAVDEAVEGLWNYFSRPAPDGSDWADLDGCRTIDDYRCSLAGSLVETCRALAWSGDGMTDPELRAISLIVTIADALELKPASRA